MGSKETNNSNPNQPQWLNDVQSGKTMMHNSDGSVSTMRTITFNDDTGKTYLAPSIRLINGKATLLTPKDAVTFASQHQDAIPFNSPEEANKFDAQLHSQEYQRLGIPQQSKSLLDILGGN